MPAPVLLAPIGVQTLLHEEGELASARAAASVGLPLVTSTASATALEEIAEANAAARAGTSSTGRMTMSSPRASSDVPRPRATPPSS